MSQQPHFNSKQTHPNGRSHNGAAAHFAQPGDTAVAVCRVQSSHNGAAAHFAQPPEPVQITSFSATYDRKFNLGNFESLNPAITIWVKSRVPEGDAYDLHDAKRRLRQMARENVRAQLQRLHGNDEAIFLGLVPPVDGQDPIFVRTVSLGLVYKVNLGDFNSVTPAYSDWSDLRHVANSPTELHLALERMWASLWANTEDELSRARGDGETDAYFGLPTITVEDLTDAGTQGQENTGQIPHPRVTPSPRPAMPT